MGIFDSSEKKRILKVRREQEHMLDLPEEKKAPKYQIINALAKTYRDEMDLSETTDDQKKKCVDEAKRCYEWSIKRGSLEAEPYIFLADYYFKIKDVALANEKEQQGLENLVIGGERRIKDIRNSLRVLSNDREELMKRKMELLDKFATLVYLCERFYRRTKVDRYRSKLIEILGKQEDYDQALQVASAMGYAI